MRPLLSASLITVLAGSLGVAQGQTVSVTIPATASFSARTSLHVSEDVLRFHVTPEGNAATVVVDVTAATRAHPRAEVLLTIEPVPANVEITFAGEGEGMLSGVLTSGAPSVAARWTGGGKRPGRIAFTLRSAAAGTYTMPLRFTLNVSQ